MRRRAPPTALHLVHGPLPPRNQPKHTLPCPPRPAFHPQDCLPRGPSRPSRMRQSSPTRLVLSGLPHLNLDLAPLTWPNGCDNTTPTSSPTSKRVRGPWDDSSSVALCVDVDRLLTPPKPVAVGGL
ncbi:hypothetical protein F5I97DRAFT_1848911 [Phlebopus sp. FC_14]|nr:hypothetical protein F5I97DRAFT_1848911 [Phlebopus sp. FC_14]